MLVRATRTASALTLRALFYGALFVVVVAAHLSGTAALRAQGVPGAMAIAVAGALVLGLVLVLVNVADWARERVAARRELLRARQGLPAGPCCVVLPRADGRAGDEMPWEVVGPMRARYPTLARRLGVEGYAIADFEVSAEGRAKNIHCVDAWPSDVFFAAAREALAHAEFRMREDVHPRFGASYRMPFVFRIAGASRVKEPGARARKLRPILGAVQRFAASLRR
ncbi:MAG: TonB family protein [Hyphomonadaceae bacterium]|nr:TonB family protein [Hyphomonadaceae bacterium]